MCLYDPDPNVAPDVDPDPLLTTQDATDLTGETQSHAVTTQQYESSQTEASHTQPARETIGEGGDLREVDYCNVFSEHRFISHGRFNMRAEILSRP